MDSILICCFKNDIDFLYCLPLCGIIKKELPNKHIVFMGSDGMQSLAEHCEHIDLFINVDAILHGGKYLSVDTIEQMHISVALMIDTNFWLMRWLKLAKIKYRYGLKNIWYHWLFANKKIKIEKSSLPFPLLFAEKALSINIPPSQNFHQYAGIWRKLPLPLHLEKQLRLPYKQILLHPFSKSNSNPNIEVMPYHSYFVLGEKKYYDYIEKLKQEHEHIPITNLCGTMPWLTLLALMQSCNQCIGCDETINALWKIYQKD